MTDTALPVPAALPDSAPTPPQKPRRRLRRVLLTLAALAVLLSAVLWWLLATGSGLRFAAFRVPSWFGIEIGAERISGSILGGFAGEKLRVQTDGADVDVSRFEFRWQPEKLLGSRLLHIEKLAAGDIHIQSKPTPPQPKSPPPALPESISLPVAVQADSIETGKITSGKKQTEIIDGFRAAYRYDHKQHRADILSLRLPWSDSSGWFTASTTTPFALDGLLNSSGSLDGTAVENHLTLTGSLKSMRLRTDLIGMNVALHADAQGSPFAGGGGRLADYVKLEGAGINPKAFLNSLPFANLTFKADVLPDLRDSVALSGKFDLENSKPAAIDGGGIPVRSLTGAFSVNDSGAAEIDGITAGLMKDGKIRLSGGVYLQKQTLGLKAELENITSGDLLDSKISGTLNGTVNGGGTFLQPALHWSLDTGFAQSTGSLKFHNDPEKGRHILQLEKAGITPKGGGKLLLEGSLELYGRQKFTAGIRSETFNPAKLYPAFPEGSINGSIKLDGELAQQIFRTEMQFAPSTLSGAQLSGSGKLAYENGYLSRADTAIRLGSNILDTKGSYGRKGSVLQLDINAPELHRFGFGLAGSLAAKGSLTSTADGWTQLSAKLDGRARSFAVGSAVRAQNLDFSLHASPDYAAPLDISVKGSGISAGGTDIDNIDAAAQGSLKNHRLNAQGSLKIDGKPLKLNLAANGGLSAQNHWQGQIGTLDVSGALNLRLQNSLRLEAGAERISLSTARWQALGGSLNLDSFAWDKKSGLTTKGSAANLHFSELHNFYKPPVEHDLVLSGEWDLAYSQSPRGYLNVRQQSGDITLPTARKQKLNLENFTLKTNLAAGGILSQLSGSTRYGQVSGNVDILQVFGNGKLIQAPLRGRLGVQAEELGILRNLLPVGQSLKGSLNADIRIDGSVGEPRLSGSVNGDKLSYRNRDIGIVLANGTLRSHLQGRQWIVDALTFHKGSGSITLTGSAAYNNDTPDIRAKIVSEHYPLLDQPNRKLIVSGSSDLSYAANCRPTDTDDPTLYSSTCLTLSGSLKTDEGRFGFQEAGMPVLDDDVTVAGETKEAPGKPLPFAMDLDFDLNDRFHFSGEGLNVTLGGKLKLSAKPGGSVQSVGSIRVVRGSYKAYGQDLVISKGVISFVGPLSDPNLNIRAERRNSPVGAGVEVLGSLSSPRVSLVANDPMSEKDKLSWLILNRASSGSSADEAAIAAAASAWFAGKVNDKLGLFDDFGLSTQQTRNAQTGEMNPAQQVLTFGKQLTRTLYLGYEAGLGSAGQTAKLVYQLSQAFQVVLRIGTVSSGGEVKFIRRFD